VSPESFQDKERKKRFLERKKKGKRELGEKWIRRVEKDINSGSRVGGGTQDIIFVTFFWSFSTVLSVKRSLRGTITKAMFFFDVVNKRKEKENSHGKGARHISCCSLLT
jgi:hypothetical protein